MFDAMGILRTAIAIEHPARRGTMIELSDVIVDTGSEYTWLPRPVLESLGLAPERVVDFVTTDGRQIERGVGFANVYVARTATPDIVVFAERGDLVLLGAHTLEGLNLRIDVIGRRLVHGGPVPAAACLTARELHAKRSESGQMNPGSTSSPSSASVPRSNDWLPS
jgi:predicted aspartyl protease